MKKTIFITLILSAVLFTLVGCTSDKTPKPPEPPKESSGGSSEVGEIDLSYFIDDIKKTIDDYSDGTIGIPQDEVSESSFMPLPENTKLPEVKSEGDLTYGGFLMDNGGYLVTVPCPDSDYKMNFILINLLTDDGKDFRVQSVYFE